MPRLEKNNLLKLKKNKCYYKWGTEKEAIVRDNVVFLLKVSDFQHVSVIKSKTEHSKLNSTRKKIMSFCCRSGEKYFGKLSYNKEKDIPQRCNKTTCTAFCKTPKN